MTNKQKKALELIKAIKDKLCSLKHGYIADEELKELEDLVKQIK